MYSNAKETFPYLKWLISDRTLWSINKNDISLWNDEIDLHALFKASPCWVWIYTWLSKKQSRSRSDGLDLHCFHSIKPAYNWNPSVNWLQIGGKLSSNISGFVNSVDSDQLASENPVDQDLHVFYPLYMGESFSGFRDWLSIESQPQDAELRWL